MFNNILNKLFNRDDGGDEPPKKREPAKAPVEKTSAPTQQQQTPAPEREKPAQRNLDIPNRITEGLELKAVPENLPGKPRAWNVSVLSLDLEGIWVSRLDADDEPLQVKAGESLALVLFDDRKRLTYDCPILRVDHQGLKEKILVGPPTKTLQEESQVRNLGGRKHLRITFRLPAEIRVVEGVDLGPPVSCHTKDISMSGLAVEASQEFQSGQEIEIRILSWNFPLKVRAFIVRCALEEEKYVIAVSFPPDLSTISQDLIGQFILENQRSS